MQQAAIKTPGRIVNAQVQRMPAAAAPARTVARTAAIPASLYVASASGAAEREADVISRQVLARPTSAPTVAAAAQPPVVQRAGGADAVGGRPVSPAISNRIRGLQNSGRPLAQQTAQKMGQRFQADFGNVRVHAGTEAAELCHDLQARAFTVGSHIFFAPGEYQPDSSAGQLLLAHELTHVIQQGGAAQQTALIQRSELPVVSVHTETQVQRFGLDTVAEKIGEYANKLPGFRMLTVVLGRNPITGKEVDRNAANVLQAAVEMIPGGVLISDALKAHGIFEKGGNWLSQQLAAGSAAIGQVAAAIRKFLGDLGIRDALSPGAVWDRGKAILTAPIEGLKAFLIGAVAGLLSLIREAILLPLGALARKTPAYELLCAVIGKDPITKQPVLRNAETLVGGFLKLIDEMEVWENMKKANAIPRVFAWFEGAVEKVAATVRQIPALFLDTFQSLKAADLLSVPAVFSRVAGIFGGFVGNFIAWAGNAIWRLLEIIFESVKPEALVYIKKTGSALKSILKNPLPFVGNLVRAAKKGFVDFAGNIGTHLKTGLIDWLTGSLKGVYIPKALSLSEMAKFVMSVLGLSWASIRGKLVKAIGPTGETIVSALETSFELVKRLITEGPMAAWEMIREQLSAMKDMAFGAIRDFVVLTIVQRAVPKLIAMFIPGAGFVSAIISIYETVRTFIQRISSMVQVVTGFLDSIIAIAAGAIDAAAAKVEGIMARLLSLAIALLAGFLGLGGISEKIQGVIEKIRRPVDKATDGVVTWIVNKAKSLFNKLTGRDKQNQAPDPRTEQERNAAKLTALNESQKVLADKDLKINAAKEEITNIGKKHRIRKVEFFETSTSSNKTRLKVLMTNSSPESVEGELKNNEREKGSYTTRHVNLGGANVGIEMVATGLNHQWVAFGKPTSGGQTELMNQLPTTGGPNNQTFIRGHLLSQKLGGDAQDGNLFPITGYANGEHERKVEKQLKKAIEPVDGKHHSPEFNYTVRVVDRTGLITIPGEKHLKYINSTLKCTIKQTSGESLGIDDTWTVPSIFSVRAKATKDSSDD